MKVILHIGTEKTGSTSIQTLLSDNREVLENHGYHFLQCAGKYNNRALPSYCKRPDREDDFLRGRKLDSEPQRREFREHFARDFEQEMHQLPENIHTVLISSEHFHSQLVHRDELESLQAFLRTYFPAITFIVYLRDQAEVAVSRYSTAIKAGLVLDLDSSIKGCHPNNPYYNYDTSLEKWESVFGIEQIDVGIFEKEAFLNRDLIEDFIGRIDPQLVGKLNQVATARNESLSYTGQLVGKAVNLTFPRDATGLGAGRLWRRLINITGRRFRGKGECIDDGQRAALDEKFRESNERVRARYFPDRPQLFSAAGSRTYDNTVGPDFQNALQELLEAITRDSCLVPQRYINVFRDAAILLEEDHPEMACELMELAHLLRPSGSLIERKLLEYRERLDQTPDPGDPSGKALTDRDQACD